MAYQEPLSITSYTSRSSGCPSWYQHCNCCPYGYHIDLDFVRYCESIGKQQVNRTGSFKRRRDRRRQRKSMEVLLGLEPSPILNFEQIHQKIIEEESPKLIRNQINIKQSLLLQDDLEEAVSDFERTFQTSNKLSTNLPDVTAVHETIRRVPSMSSMSSTSASSMTVLPSAADGVITSKEYDMISIESCGLTPAALQNIREQMALSLERTKELEERVKLIPSLQAQLSVLKEEKRQLLLEIKANKSSELNGNYLNNYTISSPVRLKIHSASVENISKKEGSSPISRRDFGVMCSVLTRNVGVGHHYPIMKTASTTTLNGEIHNDYTDKWFNEKIKFLTNDHQSFSLPNTCVSEVRKQSPILITKETQTPFPNAKKHSGSQTLEAPKVQQIKNDCFTQTVTIPKHFRNIGVLATTMTSEVSTETVIQKSTVGTSDDTTDDILCSKCISEKEKLNTQPDNNLSNQMSAISLASLTVPRSKSFNLGDDKLNLAARNRTVGCQYEYLYSHKACQHELKMQSKACQNELKLSHKGVQYENVSFSKTTDTKDLDLGRKHVACNTKSTKIGTAEIACNTIQYIPERTSPCPKCSKKEKEDIRKEDVTLPSRIPRPQPTTPVEIRKFRRQDTYTKIPSSANEASGLSGLDLSAKNDNEPSTPFEKVKQSYKLPQVSTSQNGASSSSKTDQPTTLPLPETDLCHLASQSQRKKVKPSKEMQAAMKVLNDSLQKGQTKNLKNQLKNAINIIQQEWFKISSLINANPLDVEDYLDCFEDVSFNLLRYIVNMIDVSGNTAMHYAVSHGNFDVVSILLDSKVCDINQPNKAGYTSVMLVSLAEVCSPTHANVVKRLFQLADVNIRAKQHGQTALMLAVSHGRLDMVQLLLEAGADINIQDEDGSTALMCAAEHGHIEIVKHFLSQPDCDSTITDVDGSTALKIAMEAGHRHIGVLLYAHERNLQGGSKHKRKSASASPKTPSSPLPLRSSHRALTDATLKWELPLHRHAAK